MELSDLFPFVRQDGLVDMEGAAAQLGLFLILFMVAFVVFVLLRKWLVPLVMRCVRRTATTWDDLMFDGRFFQALALFITPVIVRFLLSSFCVDEVGFFARILSVWTALAGAFLSSAFLDGCNRIYDSFPVSRNRPVKVFVQVVKIFLWCVALILAVSVLIDKDPRALILGLSAFAAVLMLVFKDAILGFVAGVQLIANHMVKIGDWIVMPSAHADGEVMEINLTTVKVQNWDKTISTIPTYRMVSESFTNWRGMEESGVRRIRRSVNIDVRSIHVLREGEIGQIRRSGLPVEWMEALAGTGRTADPASLTNVGALRLYLEDWLDRNPDISREMTCMVRQLQPGPDGLPLEVYCFSLRQKWTEYEEVQSRLFEHLYAVLPLFGLQAYQYPSGQVLAAGLAGGDPVRERDCREGSGRPLGQGDPGNKKVGESGLKWENN